MPAHPARRRRLGRLAALLLAAAAGGCGDPAPQPPGAGASPPSISWEAATYTLTTSTSCVCPCIVATAPYQVTPVDGGPGTPAIDPHPASCTNMVGKCDPVTAALTPGICGQGVAGTWRFRATATVGAANAAADTVVIVP